MSAYTCCCLRLDRLSDDTARHGLAHPSSVKLEALFARPPSQSTRTGCWLQVGEELVKAAPGPRSLRFLVDDVVHPDRLLQVHGYSA